ncbi:MAG: GGDEF domain-containing protein [Vulcanibacillus sp.]
MISFLVFTDVSGIVKDIKWSNPIYLIPKLNIRLVDLFDKEDQEDLENFWQSCDNGELSQSPIFHKLKVFDEPLWLWVYKRKEDYLVLGYQDNESTTSQTEDQTVDVLKRCIMLVAQEYNEEDILYRDTAWGQFDKIQQLNSELVNTRRLLEKANVRLKQLNQDLNNKLVRDELTDLVSRYQYRSEMEQKINIYPDRYGIFLYIDVDDFKSVNNLYGHSVGDKFLVTFAKRLKSINIRDTIGIRIAGDEFGLFIYGLEKANSEIYEKIWEEIQHIILIEPIEINGIKLPVSISVGMAIYGRDTKNIFELIDYADFAMYQAKNTGKNHYCVFDYNKYVEKHKIDYEL